jgi:hypothetical protein
MINSSEQKKRPWVAHFKCHTMWVESASVALAFMLKEIAMECIVMPLYGGYQKGGTVVSGCVPVQL